MYLKSLICNLSLKDLGNKIPLTKAELKNRIGDGGQVVDTTAEYAMLVNDNSQMCFHYEERYNNYTAIDEFPEYKKMLKGFFTEYDPGELPPRIPFDKLTKSQIDELLEALI